MHFALFGEVAIYQARGMNRLLNSLKNIWALSSVEPLDEFVPVFGHTFYPSRRSLWNEHGTTP